MMRWDPKTYQAGSVLFIQQQLPLLNDITMGLVLYPHTRRGNFASPVLASMSYQG